MADETKGNPPSQQPPQADGQSSPQKPPTSTQTTPPATTAGAAPPPKPAAPAAAGHAAGGHAPPPKPAGPAVVPWEHERVKRLKQLHGSGIKEASTYLGQNYGVVENAIAHEVLQSLRDDDKFDYLVDVTAVHYPQREQQFDVVWILYSFAKNERMRVKTLLKESEPVASVADLWPTANWLERECYDMYGIQFAGHPDLRRILLPDGWKGFPLRKDYGIIQQDKEWVQINLGIESGQ